MGSYIEAGEQGFEPRYSDPESDVLPLDDPPVIKMSFDKLCNLKGGNASQQTFKRHSYFIYSFPSLLSRNIFIKRSDIC